MSFWLGVFAGLAVWKALMVLSALVFFGHEQRVGTKEVLVESVFLVVFAMLAWYFATFGGGYLMDSTEETNGVLECQRCEETNGVLECQRCEETFRVSSEEHRLVQQSDSDFRCYDCARAQYANSGGA